MAKKILTDPSEGNKNMIPKTRGVSVLVSQPKKQQKEKDVNGFDTQNVKPYSLLIPEPMFEKLKYEICKEEKSSMRDVILNALKEKYNL